MNRSNKLFQAAVLLAVGYGVASLLGAPAVPYLPHAPAASPPTALVQGPPLTNREPGPPENHVVGGVRLLPDLSAVPSPTPGEQTVPPTDREQVRPPRDVVFPPPPLAVAQAAPPWSANVPLNAAAEPAISAAVTPSELTLPNKRPEIALPSLSAKFTDVPPRPLWVDGPAELLPVQPAAKSYPSPASPIIAPNKGRDEPPTFPRSEPPKAARLPEITAAPNSRDGQAASFQRFDLSPPPPREEGPPRTHIIVDGDSLPKLAKRYLNDPQRSEEIFAANRGLLTNPDLLPIGTELKIPAAAKATGRGG